MSENTISPKTTIWSEIPSHNKVPSEKLVYDTLSGNTFNYFNVDQSIPQHVSGGTPVFDTINMAVNYIPTEAEAIGTRYWDSGNSTTTLVLKNGVKLQDGQELMIYGKNISGSIIADGQPVAIVQSNGQFTAFGTVDITTPAAYAFVGLATQEIGINEFGYVTISGLVHDINTDHLIEGKPVYVTTGGTTTAVFPVVPNYIVNVGMCDRKHQNEGRINVITAVVPKLQDLSDVNGTPLTRTGQIPVWNNTGKFFDFNFNINNYSNTGHTHTGFTTIKIGDSVNNTEFEADGTIKFNGNATVWKDIDFPIIIRTVAANVPVLQTLQGTITAPQWQVNDNVVTEGKEFIHEWKEGSRVYWHLHMITNGVDETDRYVNWELEYCWVNVNGVVTSATTINYEYTISANTPTKTMRIVSLTNFIPTNGKIAGYIYARLKRITSVGTAPTSDPWCSMLQLHVECDTFGSRTISNK